MGLILSAFAVVAAITAKPPIESKTYIAAPHVNLSAIRHIRCDDMSWGTGFMVGKGRMVTARHVIETRANEACYDAETGAKLSILEDDKPHDMAVVTGNLPTFTNLGYIRYSCAGYTPGRFYDVLGYSTFGDENDKSNFRWARVRATNTILGPSEKWPGARNFEGYIVPGQSGGPFMYNGVAYGLANFAWQGYDLFGQVVFNENGGYPLKETVLCKDH